MGTLIQFDLDKIGIFRPAVPQDITEGNIVFLVGDGNVMYKKTVEEVYRPHDNYKAFCAEDGCMYGLSDLYVLKTGTELLQKVELLQTKIDTIQKIIKS